MTKQKQDMTKQESIKNIEELLQKYNSINQKEKESLILWDVILMVLPTVLALIAIFIFFSNK